MKKKMYFDNVEIEKKILEFQQTNNKKIIDDLVPIFNKLITGVIGKYKLLRRNFINDDLYNEAWVGILEVIPKWKKEKGDAFSYFTAVVKNKIFWYLKNQYKDTSLNSEDPKWTSIDIPPGEEHSRGPIEIKDREDQNFDIYSIKDMIEKMTVENLGLDKDSEETLNHIKVKILSGDNVNRIDLVKETQKETRIPKKKIRLVLDAMYASFEKGLE